MFWTNREIKSLKEENEKLKKEVNDLKFQIEIEREISSRMEDSLKALTRKLLHLKNSPNIMGYGEKNEG